jgi:hypothetical protein
VKTSVSKRYCTLDDDKQIKKRAGPARSYFRFIEPSPFSLNAKNITANIMSNGILFKFGKF